MSQKDPTSELAELVRLARAGQAQAVEQLVDRYAPRLFGLLYRMTGSKVDAEDLLQETYIRMLRGLAVYQENGRFEAWLFSIAANLGRDWLRHRGREGPAGTAGQADREPVVPADEAADPAARAAQAEQADLVQRAMAELTPTEREMIALRFFSQLSFKEIAQVLNVPLGTALARAHRALKHLRNRLGQQDL